ncbi:exonuclease domain-containing protein [Roseivivax isoporae]|uniref:Exonuclease domain-containing protein n=1 Tax=Roseivivax isoporae LMG 25204 TaxID=1449351 RepID=X7F3T1_9RHOB|nr:exonuclease domain-containing protein [Roseivivax isoporae]ETX27460.1 hypothetical protein RISW2_13615 [Roseivivax isoporae LMG 25204]
MLANHPTPEDILQQLLAATPAFTRDAPRDQRGIYALIDHLGRIRYIGSTSSRSQTLYERIHQRHRTGSEDSSHYYSRMYNTGRMWRQRNHPATKADGDIAKKLRNEFIAEHCRAVWVALPDEVNIAALEHAALRIAPTEMIAWNYRGTEAYEEPVDLVDQTITRLGLNASERAALDRQRQRFTGRTGMPASHASSTAYETGLPPFPDGAVRFFALDVETANRDRGSICQVGVAAVSEDYNIETWMTYVDPKTDDWSCSFVHGITGKDVAGSPTFPQVIEFLRGHLGQHTVYQHSGFDRSAVNAACASYGMVPPSWDWQDSVQIARRAWPELKGNGGHGLASLKKHLKLDFQHHDAGEDARAAAEVVLRAETTHAAAAELPSRDEHTDGAPLRGERFHTEGDGPRLIGETCITQGNITHKHIYLRAFIDAFPPDALGGSNKASVAQRKVTVDWGGPMPVITDLDGSKKFFRDRGWVRPFFEMNNVSPGVVVAVEEVAPYHYQVRCRARNEVF